jgi:hypothetical protein
VLNFFLRNYIKEADMNQISKYYKLIAKASLAVICLFATNIYGQKYEPETLLKYVKNTDQSRTLTYSVKYQKADKKFSSEAVGVPVTFTTGANKEKLITLKTNGYGEAQYIIPANQKLPMINGKYAFFATIDENPLVETKTDSISLVDLLIEMRLEVKDSIKTIIFQTFEIDAEGQKKQVPTDLAFYVPRTFSKLKIAESSSTENGTAEVEFPNDIPGDTIGQLTVIARVDENETYASVECVQTIKWGVPTNYYVAKFRRALWTTIAPTWMIITLTILLLGVWGHYMFVLYKIFRIRKEITQSESK